MLAYAVYFLCFFTIGLIILFRFLDENQKAQPGMAVDAYMKNFSEEQVLERERDFLSTLDTNVQSEEETAGLILQYVGENVRCVSSPMESTSDRLAYVLMTGDRVIGHMYLEQGEETAFGQRPWHVAGEEFDFSFLKGEPVSVTVPDTFSVQCNGTVLGSEYITESGIEFENLRDYYPMNDAIPHLCTYTVDNYLSEIELVVLDDLGNVSQIPEEEYAEYCMKDVCPQDEKAAVTEFINAFIEKYVAYTGSSKYNYNENYNALEPYMVPGSDIQQRTFNARDSFAFGGARDNIIKEVTVKQCIPLDDGKYYCEIVYFVDVRGGSGAYTLTENTAKLIVQKTDGGLKAVEMPEKTTSTVE